MEGSLILNHVIGADLACDASCWFPFVLQTRFANLWVLILLCSLSNVLPLFLLPYWVPGKSVKEEDPDVSPKLE